MAHDLAHAWSSPGSEPSAWLARLIAAVGRQVSQTLGAGPPLRAGCWPSAGCGSRRSCAARCVIGWRRGSGFAPVWPAAGDAGADGSPRAGCSAALCASTGRSDRGCRRGSPLPAGLRSGTPSPAGDGWRPAGDADGPAYLKVSADAGSAGGLDRFLASGSHTERMTVSSVLNGPFGLGAAASAGPACAGTAGRRLGRPGLVSGMTASALPASALPASALPASGLAVVACPAA
jgi:hypothetical protein